MVTMLVASGSSTAQSVRKWSLIFVGILLAVQSVAPVQSADRHLSTDREGQVTDILSRLESLDGHFIENRGQVADGILFYSLGNPAVALREDGILFVLTEREEGEVNRAGHSIAGSLGWSALSSSTVRSYAYLVRFEGANKVLPVGRDGLKFNSNFFAGKNPHFWVTDVPNYRRVAYEGIYDGIDLVLSLSHGGVKYEFLAHPGAEVAAIRMAYDGIVSLRLDGGELTTETAAGEIRDSVPYSYQGEADEVGCNYVIREVATYGFACEAFDASRTLVIDPLVYSTYIGGSGWEHAQDVFVDSLDNAFIIGRTSSLDLPVTPGAFNTTAGSGVYVAKLNAAGDSLLYSTYLYGGIANIEGYSITVDSSGNAYITGEATGRLPVTPGAFDETYNGGFCDAFVTKLNATGSSLIYSTFIGGSDWEYGKSIAIDLDGNAYVAGSTASGNFPTTAGVWQRTLNFVDAFVTKLSADGSALLYSTLLGGDGADEAKALALDAAGNAYVTGTTDSDNLVFFPMGYDWTYNGGNDAYIAKFNANASTIEYFTYLGGTGYEVGTAIAVTPGGDVLLGGLSYSHDFGMGGFHFDPDMTGPDDGFVLKLNITAHMMVFGTFIGGASWDNVASIAVDPWGNVLVTGTTESPDFPTTAGSIDTSYNGMQDAYVMRLNASEGALMYSTYLGGTGEDVCTLSQSTEWAMLMRWDTPTPPISRHRRGVWIRPTTEDGTRS